MDKECVTNDDVFVLANAVQMYYRFDFLLSISNITRGNGSIVYMFPIGLFVHSALCT